MDPFTERLTALKALYDVAEGIHGVQAYPRLEARQEFLSELISNSRRQTPVPGQGNTPEQLAMWDEYGAKWMGIREDDNGPVT